MAIFLRKPNNVAVKKVSFQECTQMFLYRKKAEKRKLRTIQTYSDELNRFVLYAEKNGISLDDISLINKEIMLEYIFYLTTKKRKWDTHPNNSSTIIGLKPKTVNNMKRIMSSFFNYLVAEKIISDNPISSIKNQPEDSSFFEVFNEEQLNNLLLQPNKHTYTGFRDFVMMLIMIDNGIRTNELLNLRVEDLDLSLEQIVVHGGISKNGKTRILPLSKKTTQQVKSLIEYCRLESDNPLILNQYGEKFSGDTFAKNIKKYGYKAGITGVRCSPHTLRHTFATMYLLNGGDTMSLQRILGHSDQTMVARYVHFTNSDIKEQHTKYSPVENLNVSNYIKGKIRFR